jgi:hypothetical protein
VTGCSAGAFALMESSNGSFASDESLFPMMQLACRFVIAWRHHVLPCLAGFMLMKVAR